MNASRLLIATACSLAVAGGASMVYAQTTTPSTGARDSTMPGSTNSTTQSQSDEATRANKNSSTGTSGTAATRSSDDNLRSDADRATMGTERAARADRN